MDLFMNIKDSLFVLKLPKSSFLSYHPCSNYLVALVESEALNEDTNLNFKITAFQYLESV